MAAELLLNAMTDTALLVLDAQGNIASWNRGAEEIFGWSAGDALGRSAAILYLRDGTDTRGFGRAGIDLGIGDIDRDSITYGSAMGSLGFERLWEQRPQGSVASVVDARERDELDLIAFDPGHRTRVPP